MQLNIGKPLDQAVDDRALPKALEPANLVVREDQMGRPMRSSDLFEPGNHVGGLHADDLGAEVDGIVEGLLDVAGSIERLALSFRRLDNDSDQGRMDRAGELGGLANGPQGRRAAVHEDEHTIGIVSIRDVARWSTEEES